MFITIIIYIIVSIIFKLKNKYFNLNKSNKKNKYIMFNNYNRIIYKNNFLYKKINEFLKSFNNNILQVKKINNKFNYISFYFIIFFSFFLMIISFAFSYKIFHIVSTSLILSIISFFIPNIILKYILNKHKEKLMCEFPTYAITLKNYTKVNNDLIFAFKRASVTGAFKKYIETFNFSIEKGLKVDDCFEKLKNDININKINNFFTAACNCYKNGGDFSKLLDKYSNILTKVNLQKEKEKEESFSSKLVLYILVFVNIYLLFGFVFNDEEYKNLLLNTFFGKIIINFNILSYIFIMFFIKKINKMEE